MTTTLRVAVRRFGPFETGIVKQFEDFAATTGVDARIEIEAFDLNPLHETLIEQRGLADGSWDLAFLSTDWIAEVQALGLVVDLLPFQQREPIDDFPQAWSESLLGLQQFAGGLWGMPYHDGPECLMYRKDLFEAKGLAVPTTWDEYVEAARQLNEPEQGRYGTALALFPDGHNGFYDFCIHVWTRGGEPFAADGTPTLVSDAACAALDFIRTLARDTSALAPEPQTYDSVRAGLAFCEGKVALAVNWFGFAALAQAPDSAVTGLVDVAPIPAALGAKSVSLNVFWLLSMAAGSRHKDLGWRFMRHCASAPMDRLTTLEGAIGTRLSTWRDAEVNARIPFYHKLEALHESAREMPRHARLADISHAVDTMIERAVNSNEASRALLEATQVRIEEIVR
ncbi:extracellular solute-binding protein [Paraburkholderia sp. DHOC27]|uniref:extracellular solute-binding protein n=1 Tax=Paraburkholderia sp. DHOC27 TaxID=2303330 RepID=UPI000E3C9E6E|nr:extracellular solute-binding protein [Paraburkholderia sp. DHOC27]RFU48435.1 extracellular solute-binding protein [Paraburkholderia sp. DHOC27]